MRLCDLAPAHIRAISPYQPGKPISELAREMGLDEASIVKLASNENPLGVGEKTRAAMQQALVDIARYPDGNGFELKTKLAARCGVTPAQVTLGNGSNDILDLVARAWLAPGLNAVFSQYAFAVYPIATQAVGAQGKVVPAKAHGHDLEAMLAAIDANTRVVFVANPNNPTGTWFGPDALEAFLSRVPPHVLVVLDEAYIEFAAGSELPDGLSYLARYPNLIVTRTLCKAYGLAGLRVGYALASAEIADLMNRIRQPFNCNNLALAAAAAALNDHEFLARSHASNLAGMAQIVEGVKRLGVTHIPSRGNFVCIKPGDAASVNQKLLKQGVIVRPIASYGLPDWLRITIGAEAENQRFLEALEVALA